MHVKVLFLQLLDWSMLIVELELVESLAVSSFSNACNEHQGI